MMVSPLCMPFRHSGLCVAVLTPGGGKARKKMETLRRNGALPNPLERGAVFLCLCYYEQQGVVAGSRIVQIAVDQLPNQ